MAKVWWIKRDGEGQLGLMSRPEADGLRDQLRDLRSEGAEEIICLMSQAEIDQHGLTEFGDACDREGLKFKRFSLPPDGTPAINSGLDDFLQATARDLRNGRKIVLQCNTGRARCAMIAAALLALEGMDADTSLKALRAARHARVTDNDEQEQWIRMYAQQARPRRKAPQAEPFFQQLHPAVYIGAAASLIAAVAAVLITRRRR